MVQDNRCGSVIIKGTAIAVVALHLLCYFVKRNSVIFTGKAIAVVALLLSLLFGLVFIFLGCLGMVISRANVAEALSKQSFEVINPTSEWPVEVLCSGDVVRDRPIIIIGTTLYDEPIEVPSDVTQRCVIIVMRTVLMFLFFRLISNLFRFSRKLMAHQVRTDISRLISISFNYSRVDKA